MKSFLLSFALLSVVSTSAHALSCAEGPYASMPMDGAVDVPTNAQVAVWSYNFGSDRVALQFVDVASGEEVAASITPVDDSGGLILIQPDEELAANTAYAVNYQYTGQGTDEHIPFMAFETGADRDEAAPEKPVILSVEKGENTVGEWGPTDYVEAEIADANEPVYYRVELASDGDFGTVETSTVAHLAEKVSVGHQLCFNTLSMDAMDVKAVRMTAIDLAGNESVVSESSKAVGCSAIGAAGLGWFGLSVVPLVLRRRRA